MTTGATAPDGPLQLFDELPRGPGAVPELWRQQGEILTDYAKDLADSADVAIELPTGTGKTLVGLLIADWRRRRFRLPVLYACPTQQLVHQVAAAARREGMPGVVLVGTSKAWPESDKHRYFSADALGLTTYSSIFNASPKVGEPGTIVFDDAHAAEQYVAEAWAVQVDRRKHGDVYDVLLEAVRPALNGMFHQRMRENSPDLAARTDVRLVVPLRRHGLANRLNAALAKLPEGSSAWFAWNTVKPGLASCLVYVSWSEILIRPVIPPTNENRPFNEAGQRVYLSATPGRAGELARSFGRPKIKRLLLPDGRSPRSGRRFFVFPELANQPADGLQSGVTSLAGKALVLAASLDRADQVAAELNVNGWPVMHKDDIEKDLKPFVDKKHAVLALAGRYDGIDLPNEACRLVCLAGLPDLAHLQERFLATNLRARVALDERIRTRVVQGVGRATRNPLDHAVVLVRGDDLTEYLVSPARRQTLDIDLQAEVAFGLDNSREMATQDLLTNTRIFLEQGDEWFTDAEAHLADAKRSMSRVDQTGSSQLAASAEHEVAACARAFRGDYDGACADAQRAASALAGEDALRTYRGFWLYLAATFAFAASEADPAKANLAQGLLRQAEEASKPATWLREAEAGTASPVHESADDTPGVRLIAGLLEDGIKRSKVQSRLKAAKEGVLQTSHTKVEPALSELGRLLGAEAFKPSGQGRADSVWCWGEQIWVTHEAKTEEGDEGEVPLRDVRQANGHLDQLSTDRGVSVPRLAASVIVSPKSRVVEEGMAQARSHVYLLAPGPLVDLANDAEAMWDDLLLQSPGQQGSALEALVRKLMAEHQLLPTQVLERITVNPIAA